MIHEHVYLAIVHDKFFFEDKALCVMLEFAVGAVVSVEKNVSSATHRCVICKFNRNNDQSVSL